jgi:hypothetical protein
MVVAVSFSASDGEEISPPSSSQKKLAITCAEITKSYNLPCATVPRCSSGSVATLVIDTLSNGKYPSKAASTVEICYNPKGLVVPHNANDQQFFSENGYDSCNDAIYNLDVAELFIAPVISSEPDGPHCYNEIDISPRNIMFESGIYNANLTQSTLKNALIDCDR